MQKISDYFFYVNLTILSLFLLLILYLFVYPFNGLLIWFLFPDSITTHQDEINSFFQVKLVSVWIRGDCLLFWFQMLPHFVLEVTKGSGEIQVAVNTSFGDGGTRVRYTIDFCLTLWLVIYAHFNRLSVLSHDASGISCISNVDFLQSFVDIYYVRSASYGIKHHFFVC